MRPAIRWIIRVMLLGISLAGAAPVLAADADELGALLHEFLAAADQRWAHEKFWADDLIYTSSAGTRTDKASILQGFDSPADDQSPSANEPAVVYSAEAVDIRVHGAAAVVAFKLVGTPADGSEAVTYFNTGTFLKRRGTWQAVAWQATKIPLPVS